MEPWAVVNAAGYVRVDDAERDREGCRDVNAGGAVAVARACDRVKARLVTFSSDLVFDGEQSKPYVESDVVSPLNVYGRSKVEAERGVQEVLSSALIVRTSAFFGPEDAHNFVTVTLRRLEKRESVKASTSVVSPTYVPDLVDVTLDLLVDDAEGVWHLSNRGEVSWAELARRSAEMASMDESLIEACTPRELGLAAPRPVYSALGSERGILLPSLDDSLGRYFEARRG
jgi:dTDP-4-dehydrorhamnose reductase